MTLAGAYYAPPGDSASAIDSFAYVALVILGGFSLLLLLSLNVAAAWWVLRRFRPQRVPAAVQHTEDSPGWTEHAERVLASERDLARLRADHPDLLGT